MLPFKNREGIEALTNKGIALFGQGKLQDALEIFDEALKIDPKNESALYCKGYTFYKLDKFQEAVEVCDESLKINPRKINTLLIKGDSFSRLNKHKEALEVFDEALKIDPKNEFALNNKNISSTFLGKTRGLSCAKCGTQFSLTEKQYCSVCGASRSVFTMNIEEMPFYHLYQGRSLFSEGKFEESIKFYDKALTLDPMDTVTLYNKGLALHKLKKYHEAEKMYLVALNTNPKYTPALNNIATILFETGRFKEAIELLEKVLNIDPKFVDALYNKGYILHNLGRYEEAISMYKKVLEINPNNLDARANRDGALRAISECKEKSAVSQELTKTYLFFDTETTGLPRNWNAPVSDSDNWPRLVQIAWALYKNGIKVSSSDFIIKPEGFKIPIDASDIHGITTERAEREGASLQMVLNEFQNLVAQANFLVCHNMSFDEKIVGAEFLRKNMPNSLVTKKTICTKERSTNFCAIPSTNGYKDYKWPTLLELHMKLFGTVYEDSHNAVADVNATVRCFWEMKKRGIL